MISYYDVLNIPRFSNVNDVKSAFRTLAKQYHPDVCERNMDSEKFKNIVEAYKILSDEESKTQYDNYLKNINDKVEKFASPPFDFNIKVPSNVFQENEYFQMQSLIINGGKSDYQYHVDIGWRFIDSINISSKGIIIIKRGVFLFNKTFVHIKFHELEKIDLGDINGFFSHSKQLILVTDKEIIGHSTKEIELFNKYCRTLSFYVNWFSTL
ncbi:MAG TPA: DnaJ domain-containing protein [bacterium]|nr:DnaJ domain-containing protein [bacterium]